MSNQELIERARDADFPEDLSHLLNEFIAAIADLRPLTRPSKHYELNFGERVLLRETLDPDEHENHWWQSGLAFVRQWAEDHAPLRDRYGESLIELEKVLTHRLGPYEEVSLREIDSKTVSGICLLSELMRYPQDTFVAPNSYSLAEALFHDTAWYRAVYAGKAPIGFIMLEDDEKKPEYYLWRFMIAPPFQRSGYGAKAISLLIDYVKTRPNATELFVSYIPHEKGPAGFYRGLGFKETGEVDGIEVEMKLEL